MPRGKSSKVKPYEKLLIVMSSGKPVTIEEIDATLGKEIHMYRLSTYIYEIKVKADGVIKTVKNGRQVVSYQLTNAAEVKKFMERTGLSKANFVPGQTAVAPSQAKAFFAKQKAQKKSSKKSVKKLDDLAATPVVSAPTPVVAEEMQVTEVTDAATAQ